MVDVEGAAFAARTYLEQAEVRRYARMAGEQVVLRDLADVGCGFGRLTPVLGEFGRVVGFEREPEFCSAAAAVWPTIEFRAVRRLSQLPAPSGSFGFALTFTVLQHLPDPLLPDVVAELLRVLRRPGFLLLCEETDPEHQSGDRRDPAARVTVGRPVEVYERALAAMRLVETSPRRIEPTYPRPDVGTYMLFGYET